jgi:hypothetical protein
MTRSSLLLACFFAVLVLGAPSLVLASNSNSAEHGGLLHVIETDKYLYQLPEFVHISYSVSNVSGGPLEVALGWCWCPIPVAVADPSTTTVWCAPCGCVDEACLDTLAVGESYSKHVTWDMYDTNTEQLIEELGVYTVWGDLATYDPDLWFTIDLKIEIEESPTAVPDSSEPEAWGIIKAMYR